MGGDATSLPRSDGCLFPGPSLLLISTCSQRLFSPGAEVGFVIPSAACMTLLQG